MDAPLPEPFFKKNMKMLSRPDVSILYGKMGGLIFLHFWIAVSNYEN